MKQGKKMFKNFQVKSVKSVATQVSIDGEGQDGGRAEAQGTIEQRI